ncbi:unnamed protein product [Effrenium voratum]|nr:unnamed protein product [Effrenium voratum]
MKRRSSNSDWNQKGYTLCTLGGALFVSIFVLTRWRAAEVVFSIERLTDEISPIRWSRCVLGLWDFRLRKAEEKALWGQPGTKKTSGEGFAKDAGCGTCGPTTKFSKKFKKKGDTRLICHKYDKLVDDEAGLQYVKFRLATGSLAS